MAQPVRPPQRIATSAETSSGDARFGASRREFLQFLIGGSTLMIGGVFLSREEADALPGPGNTSDVADLGDSLIAVEQPYKYNLVLEVTAHNRVRFELPREDKGQGIATALAMMVAEEMDADYDRVDVELSDRRADRPTTITGGSSTIRTMWEPARTVAANARLRLVTAAANRWGLLPTDLRVAKSMVIHDGSGRRASFGELSAEAAALALPVVPLPLKAIEDHTIVGTSRGRKNARAIVTGQQKYTMDLGPEDGVPANATPAVVARPPDIKGYVVSINNQAAVEAMPGVVGVVQIDLPDRAPVPLGATFPQPTGVAVAADTFHHAFAARDALDITWGAGPMAGESSDDHLATLESIALPLTPVVPPNESFTASFDFPYVAHAPLEVMGAVADVQGTDSATIWFPSQTPNHVCGQIAAATGVADANVTMHVPFAGGAFGRRLFGEPAVEAAVVSQALGRPIKLLWSRNDDMRHGRFRPMTHHDIRATWLDGVALTFEHRVAAAETDLRHGYGDAIFGPGYTGGNAEVDQAAFGGTVSVPYEFGVTSQLMITQHFEVPTCSWRSIHSGFTMTANEIFVDALARARGADEVQFRLDHLAASASPAAPAAIRVLEKVAEMGDWGRAMPAGHAQGVAVHAEYRSAVAYLVEIDTTGAEPRLTASFAAVDVGVPINRQGLAAQIEGALVDGWSVMFRASNHLVNGAIVEGSYGDFLWSRIKHVAPTTEVFVFDATSDTPGGAGELGLPPGSAACVNAYARATGTEPRRFPILEFPPS